MFKKSLFTILLAGATLLTGCGRAPATSVGTRALTGYSAQGAVGIPASYRSGVQYPGMPGVPGLKSADFPRFTHTADGKPSDPVNVLVAGTADHVRHVFGATGWAGADPISVGSVAKTIKTGLLGGSYRTAPLSTLLLYNRPQDMAYQKNNVGVVSRDHLRVWKTPLTDGTGRPFWAIAATKDIAIKHGAEAMITHQISADIDAERDMVVGDFMKSGHVKMRYEVQVHPGPMKGVNGGGDVFFTDGKVVVLELVPIH